MKFDFVNYMLENKQLGIALAAAIEKYHVNFKKADLQATKNYGPMAPLFLSESALLTQDHEGRLNFYNFSAAKVFGYSPFEAIGLRSLELVPEDARRERAEIFHQVVEEGQVVDILDNRITNKREIVRINALVFPYELNSKRAIAARVELLGTNGQRVIPLITP